MFLSSLKIWNFRKYGSDGIFNLAKPDFNLSFNKGLTVLIGLNDSGKTAIVDAIKIVTKTHGQEWIKVEEEDFYCRKDGEASKRFRIECRFDDLTVPEASHFVEWLQWDDSINPKREYLRVFIDVTRNNERILPYDVKAGADDDGTSLTAEAREKLRATYLRPLRDAENELSARRNSRLSQILHSHDAFKNSTDHLFVELTRKLNKEIKAYFKGVDGDGATLVGKQHGKKLKEDIDFYLKRFLGRETQFEITDSTLKGILETLNLLFLDGYHLGLGSHNLLSIASELLHLQKENWDGLRLGLVEEIEAHLHPQVQLQVMETLQANATNVQLIFTTHSPNIGSKIPLDHLVICQNNNVYPMGATHTLLAETDYTYLQRFLDVTKANLFFARGVILVEGWAEELILPALAEKININITSSGISIINIGNTAFLRFARIFQRAVSAEMNIRVAVVTDVDVKPLEAGEEHMIPDPNGPELPKIKVPYKSVEIAERIKAAISAKETKYNGQVVKSFISPFWTLEYCIAKSKKLRQLFYHSVLQALKEQKKDDGVKNLESYDIAITDVPSYFSSWKDSDDEIAFRIYDHILNGNTTLTVAKDAISKAIIAQHFARNLESDTVIAQLETDPSILYLIDAIKYAANK